MSHRVSFAGLFVWTALLAMCPDFANAANAQILVDCADCSPVVVVPPRRFMMGSVDGEKNRPEGPIHEVRFARPFALGQFEVTLAEFRRFVAATGHVVSPGCRVQGHEVSAETGRVEWFTDKSAGWVAPGFRSTQPEDSPVVCVGRIDALAYVAWLAMKTGKPYRLPSESEWEYAAAAGTHGAFSWGNNQDLACEHGNLYDRAGRRANDFGWGYVDCDDGFAEIAPVGKFRPNNFGLHDMLGNVWEWTADCYRATYDRTPTDGSPEPSAPDCDNWSVRGGGWMTRPSRQRLSFRGRDPNDAHYSYFGFRVARDLSASEIKFWRRRK
jgi:formylglycine-generating enzyme required for sulfatase activity